MALRRDVPTASLRIELEEVARSANKFREATLGANVSSAGFPKNELVLIATGLCMLPDGTAEGCRIPLEYARTRLPAIRREFFSTEHADASNDDDASPARGFGFDQALTELIGSVVTALDEYRRLAGEAVIESIVEEKVGEPGLMLDETISRLAEVSSKNLDEARTTVENTILDESRNKAKLVAQIVDTKTVTNLAQAEMAMRPFFVRWVKAMGQELARAPRRLQQLGRTIQIGADVAEPLAKRWSSFWSNFEAFLFGELRSLGSTIEEVGHNIEAHTKLSSPGAKKPNDPREFAAWVSRFVSERETNGTGLLVAEIALAVQFNFRVRPKDFAKSMGQKRLTDLLGNTEGVSIVNGVHGPRVVLEKNQAAVNQHASASMKIFREKMRIYKGKYPTCTAAQFSRWLRTTFPSTSVLPDLSVAELLEGEGYRKASKGMWQLIQAQV